MTRFQPFNDLAASQFELLKKDVEQRGIVNPILVDEDGQTIDGHQRRRVAAELGIDCPRIVLRGLSDDEKMSLAIALNLFRRHLSGVERSTAIQKMSHLGMSVRRIAEATGVSKSQVHRDLAGVPCGTPAAPDNVDPETGELSDAEAEAIVEAWIEAGTDEQVVPKVVGADGRSYPAKKPKPAPRELTAEEQAAEDLKGQIRRAAARLEQLVTGWLELPGLASHPQRDDVLALLNEHDLRDVLEIEAIYERGVK